ncbi:MAG: type III-A CRISPR-associated protein Csm2 [Candidatus Hydrogenedentes bacterium]|nr:type III-A CRISPR-associated protein Csm2 [Candidatus Hydrogenedentota bacterium]
MSKYSGYSHYGRGNPDYQDQRNVGWTDNNFLAKMVQNEIDETFIETAKRFGKFLVEKKLNTTQIRKIFGQVKKIEPLEDPKKFLPQLLMLLPIMDYTVDRNRQVEPLRDVLEPAIKMVNEAKNNPDEVKKRFRLFCRGFEAIIAYHRAAGGK